MRYHNILLNYEHSAATITIHRPDKLNALNTATFKELDHALLTISQKSSIKIVFITGGGSKAFVAGADISEIQSLPADKGEAFSAFGQKVFSIIENFHIPVIALIDGFALGGGMELTMACHLRIATAHSKFGQPEVNLGLIPGYGGTQRLPRLVGKGIALELLLTADMINAARAYEIGLINRIVSTKDELNEVKNELIQKITSKGPLAIRHIIYTVNNGLNSTLENGMSLEAEYFGKCCTSKDMKEGTSAFIEKRKAKFTGA
jgi:enoyl-CoA hydratase